MRGLIEGYTRIHTVVKSALHLAHDIHLFLSGMTYHEGRVIETSTLQHPVSPRISLGKTTCLHFGCLHFGCTG